MSLLKVAGTAASSGTLYVNDVFSTYLYTGTSNGSTGAQTITNGIDLAGKGGMVWIKNRTTAYVHNLEDTSRGIGNRLKSDSTTAQNYNAEYITSFNSNGFSIGLDAGINQNTDAICSWTFRKAPKFFDVVTYTGNGVAGRSIAHNLQSTPAIIFIKATSNTSSWFALCRKSDGNYARGASSYNFALNTTEPAENYSGSSYQSNASVFYPSDVRPDANNETNIDGYTYVAYLYAHDTSSTGIIQCGSWNATGNDTITLGWEPQYILLRKSDGTDDWQIFDTMRRLPTGTTPARPVLYPNLSIAEDTLSSIGVTATGFISTKLSGTYIYMAIRRPNKPPTSGTQVFKALAQLGGPSNPITTGFVVDMSMAAITGSVSDRYVGDRLRGSTPILAPNSTATEYIGVPNAFNFNVSNTGIVDNLFGGNQSVWWNFKRAPGFFDVVCYTTTGAGVKVNHNLGVSPELVIYKTRSVSENWYVCVATNGIGYLNSTSAWAGSGGSGLGINYANVSATQIAGDLTTPAATNVAYLFATLAGISKVGSYTGNGTTQNIECGFAAGARFFLVKATSTTGSWWVWDSARGITAGNDPALQLNSTAAEITTADAVDPYAAGITVNQEATCSINASGVSYIFLAIS